MNTTHVVRRGTFAAIVDSDDPCATEQLQPYFSVGPSGARVGSIDSAIRIRTGAPPEDSDYVWQTANWTVARTSDSYYVASSDGRGVARLVRELWKLDIMRNGAVQLHAAALCDANGATLFVGPKRSGKTTCVLAGLSIGLDLLANDDAVLGRGRDDKYRAFGSSRGINIRREALQYTPNGEELRVLCRERGTQTSEGWRLTPWDLAGTNGVRADAALENIVFVDLGPGPLVVEELDCHESCARLLAANCFVPADDLNAFLSYEMHVPTLLEVAGTISALAASRALRMSGSITDPHWYERVLSR